MTETNDIRIDPTLSTLLRPLQPHEVEGLEADILRDGCMDPIVVWNGVLVDGHHRYAICQKHNIPFRVKQMKFASPGDACLWAWGRQDHRRNTNPFDRGERLLQCEALVSAIKAKAKQRMQQAPGQPQGAKKSPVPNLAQEKKSRDELARAASVSHGTLDKIQTLIEYADAQTKQRLRAGETSIHAAYKAVQKGKQQAAKAQAKAALPEDLPDANDRFVVHHGALADVGGRVAEASVDWIITDPPYPKEHLGLYGEVSDFASRVLKPGGSLLCLAGQSYLPDVLEQLGKRLTYCWTLAFLTPGGQSAQLWERKVNTFWKPLLWYVKGVYAGDWIGDVCRSDVNANEKEHHRWGQSESGMADIVERFTFPGETICDPFCGGGTTGVVAVRTNRLFVGIDSEEESVATTLRRLSEAAPE